MAIHDLGQDTRGWRVLLVQQANPVMIYVNPSTDADAFDEWQTPPREGERVPVGRPRADNQTAQLRMETAVSPRAPRGHVLARENPGGPGVGRRRVATRGSGSRGPSCPAEGIDDGPFGGGPRVHGRQPCEVCPPPVRAFNEEEARTVLSPLWQVSFLPRTESGAPVGRLLRQEGTCILACGRCGLPMRCCRCSGQGLHLDLLHCQCYEIAN